MRADRLISVLMLLQTSRRMTARQLADELEVSERTIYRDIDALSISGIPVYADYGPGGGYSLLESYRTDLSGMNREEVRALFMLSIPAPLVQLGVDQELKGAFLKLSAALSGSRKIEEILVRQRIHLDSTWWFQGCSPIPHLQTLHAAIWDDRRVVIRYQVPFGYPAEIEHHADAYGLVAKAGVWFFVFSVDGRMRVRAVSELLNVSMKNETFERKEDFDLALFWKAWSAEYESNRPNYIASVRIAPELMRILPGIFGEKFMGQISPVGASGEDGWIATTLSFESFESARSLLLSFGRAVVVLEPEPLRLSILDYARQTIHAYSSIEF